MRYSCRARIFVGKCVVLFLVTVHFLLQNYWYSHTQMLSERLQMSLSRTHGVIATELCAAQSKGFIRTPYWILYWAAWRNTYGIRKNKLLLCIYDQLMFLAKPASSKHSFDTIMYFTWYCEEFNGCANQDSI